MTETNPEGARPTAGRVGAHRQDFSESVTEPESLNVAPQRLPTPAEEGGHHQDDLTRVRQADLAKVRQDIERTRDDLGDTIEALAAKADIRARARERIHATTTRARGKASTVADRVRSVAPEPVRGAACKVGEQARRHPRTAAASVGAAAAGLVIARGITRMTRNRGARPRTAPFGPRLGGRAGGGMRLTGRPARGRRRISARMGRRVTAPFARRSPMARLARLMGMAGGPRRHRMRKAIFR